jgi:hypothetical protein
MNSVIAGFIGNAFDSCSADDSAPVASAPGVVTELALCSTRRTFVKASWTSFEPNFYGCRCILVA